MINLFKKEKKKPKDIKEVLEQLEALEEKHQDLSQELADFKKESRQDLKKVGIIRFNPFGEVGGDQSFSIALLDSDNNGLVITSHYAREANRIYAKPVQKGKSSYALSEEEKSAIKEAINS